MAVEGAPKLAIQGKREQLRMPKPENIAFKKGTSMVPEAAHAIYGHAVSTCQLLDTDELENKPTESATLHQT
jgi:hypothetical protein